MQTTDLEAASLGLLKSVQHGLVGALDALGGQEFDGKERYLLQSAYHVARLTFGYCVLRGSRQPHLVYASKSLVRPVMESVVSACAAVRDPSYLYRRMYHEWEQNRKLINEDLDLIKRMEIPEEERKPYLERANEDHKTNDEGFASFASQFEQTYPNADSTNGWSVQAAATKACLGTWYAGYRKYCQVTHGAWSVISGGLETGEQDNLVMAWLNLIVLDHMKDYASANVEDLGEWWRQANVLLT